MIQGTVSEDTLRSMKNLSLVGGLLVLLLGLLLVCAPSVTAETICVIFGILVTLCGVVFIIGYLIRREDSLLRYGLALGMGLLVPGILLIVHPGVVTTVVWVLVGLNEILDGAVKLQIAFEAKRAGYPRWWILLIAAGITAAFGIFLTFDPGKGGEFFIRVVGVSLLLAGCFGLYTGFYLAHFLRKG